MPTGECPYNLRKRLFIYRKVCCFNKGIRILLNAYQQISPDPELWPLILVGDGPLRDEIQNIIVSKKLKGIQLPGFVSEADRHRYTSEAKWMITPPHTQEDLGLTPLEARSVEVPCIATTDGGVKETAGPHALYCKPGDINSLSECMKRGYGNGRKSVFGAIQIS